MLEQYRQALRAQRVVATSFFVAMVVLLVVIHWWRQKASYIIYAFEVPPASRMTPDQITTRIQAIIEARAVLSAETAKRDDIRFDIKALSPRSGPVVILSVKDDKDHIQQRALNVVATDLERLIEKLNRAAKAGLETAVASAQSEIQHYEQEVSALSSAYEQSVAQIVRLSDEIKKMEQAGFAPPDSVRALHLADLRSRLLSYRSSTATLVGLLRSARISRDIAKANLDAALAELATFRGIRRLYGPHLEKGKGFGTRSWVILLMGCAVLAFVIVPLLGFKKTHQD